MSKETILVIQSDKQSAYLIDLILSREGFHVVTTTDCFHAKTLLQEMDAPHLIILDLAITTKNDKEIFNFIKDKTEWHHIPVILLATEYRHEAINLAMQAGAKDFIVCPFAYSELLGKIEHHAIHPG